MMQRLRFLFAVFVFPFVALAQGPIEVKVEQQLSVPQKDLLAVHVTNERVARIVRHPLTGRLKLHGVAVGRTLLVRTVASSNSVLVSEVRVVPKPQKKRRPSARLAHSCRRGNVLVFERERCALFLPGWD